MKTFKRNEGLKMKHRYMVEIEFERTEVYVDTYEQALAVAMYLESMVKRSSKETIKFHIEHESEILINWFNNAGEWQTVKTYKIFED